MQVMECTIMNSVQVTISPISVIVVRCTGVMLFAGCQYIADQHNADCTFFFCDLVFPFSQSADGVHVLRLLRGDEEDFLRQYLAGVVVLDGHIYFRFLQRLVDGTNYLFLEP